MKTNLLANLANKTFAFATVMMMGLAFVACSSDDDKNADENLKPMTVTIGNVDKKVVAAEYKNLGYNNYWISLYLSDDGKESVEFNLNTERHINKDIYLTKAQESEGPGWRVVYNDKDGQELIVSDGTKSNNPKLFKDGKLKFEGDPNGTITITLTNGNVMGTDDKEHTIQISYKATSLNDAGFVDLGLSVKWAADNLGGNPGFRCAWGEITPKQNYNWANYKWGNADENILNKYSTDNNYGQADNVTTLLPEDDAATNFYKSQRYRMPTKEEFEELLEKCKWTWTKRGSVYGFEVSRNDRSIFLPSTGHNKTKKSYTLRYWSSTLNTNNCKEALILSGSKTQSNIICTTESSERAYDLCIRPVRQ